MKRPVFLHIKSTRNLGDLASCPADGFPEFDDCRRECWTKLNSIKSGTPIIFGGGGLFMPDIHKFFWKVSFSHPVAVWGAGLNYPPEAFTLDEGSRLAEALRACGGPIGVRNPDFAKLCGFHYVPCASCMSKVFDMEGWYRESRFGTVAYEHTDARFAGSRFPAKTNAGDSLFEAVEFLRSARNIITNSYHGAYWGHLIGKSTAIWQPARWGNRFRDMYPNAFRTVETFEDVNRWRMEPVISEPGLDKCRAINRDFCNLVLDWLNTL